MRYLCHSFAILILFAASVCAQSIEIVTTSGKKTVTEAKTVGIVIDGGGSAITTGVKGYLQIPFNATITGWTILADTSGSCVVDVWKDTYANYPPTIADVITASAKPTLTAATKATSTTLTGWTTTITAGDVLAFNVNSASTVTRITVTLSINRR